jgi:hypothetical protein
MGLRVVSVFVFGFLMAGPGASAFAQEQEEVEQDVPQPRGATPQRPLQYVPPPDPMCGNKLCGDNRYVGIHVAANLGLFAIDVQAGHFYGMIAGNAAVPLLSNGDYASFTALGGYSAALRRSTRGAWKMDLMLQVTPGWTRWFPSETPTSTLYGFVGVGATVGFRYESRGGFSLGFRIPVFGYAIGRTGPRGTIVGVGNYYLASIVSLPIVSFGYRF